MGLTLSLFAFLRLQLLKLLLFLPLLTQCFATSLQPSCHDHERSALWKFRQNFVMDKSSCRYPDDYPKPLFWDQSDSDGESSSNCCSWDGVECDEETGHVIGLDLNSSCLYGSIDSNSTLFHLAHLQKLNLAFNRFNYSLIPCAIGQFSEMTYLNLSYSDFSGQIPYEISRLSKLSTLDLSTSDKHILKLRNPNLRSLTQNLSSLENLFLSYVDMSSKVPNFLANFSSLTRLGLNGCGLYGSIPSSLGKLTKLTYLNLEPNFLSGYIPSSIQNLTQLTWIAFGNEISGPIPSWLGNLTKLTAIDFSSNELYGPIPQSLFKLENLQNLFLDNNNLGGTLQFDMFLKMRHLSDLRLDNNKFSFLFGEGSINATLPKLTSLSLSSCNISEFPDFLRHQNKLVFLDLSNNSIYGKIPKWILNSSAETMKVVNISHNLLTGFHHLSTILPWVHLHVLDIHSNMLQGQLPIPASSTEHYDASNNKLSGKISPLICNLSLLSVFDLSNNNFSGMIPRCLGNFSDSLLVWNLKNNSFQGSVPHLDCKDLRNLRMVDFSNNQLQGQLPRSLTNCKMLEYLDFSNNDLFDIFPTWLGSCPELKVLILRNNGFHGVIGKLKNNFEFPNLRIIDISCNSFTGPLPSDYIFIWNAMRAFKKSNSEYMKATELIYLGVGHYRNIFYHDYATTIIMKSVETFYGKIREELALIDLSSNKFSGEIPEFLGKLMALHSLNVSNNMLIGHIPSSLGNLSQLESLDLSQNMLSGEIPQQLVQLNFLQHFNVSHNNLTGPIPQGNQLRTFDQSSFEDNPGLCGDPLPNKCENSKALPLPPLAIDQEDDDDDSGFLVDQLDWKFILAGCISGLVVGVALGDMVMTKRHMDSCLRLLEEGR